MGTESEWRAKPIKKEQFWNGLDPGIIRNVGNNLADHTWHKSAITTKSSPPSDFFLFLTPCPNFETPRLRQWNFVTQCRTQDRSQHVTNAVNVKLIQAFCDVMPCPLVIFVPICQTHNPIGSSPCEEFQYLMIMTIWQSKKVRSSILLLYEGMISRYV